MGKKVTIREVKSGEFAGYYGVYVGRRCGVYTPAWSDAVEQRDKLQRQQDGNYVDPSEDD